MREYELMFVVDPRLTDEDTVALTDQYREMIQSAGGEVFKEESWGKRKLAYQINKLSEGSYILFFVRSDEGTVFQEVEQRMRQNEDVLRYLTVRTDAGRLRHRAPREEQSAEADAAEAAASDAKEAS
jgi:small subunit ribosomal protein S6